LVTARTVENALTVPASAILNLPETGAAVVLVGSDSRAHLRPVQVGIENGDQVEITSGLQAGQQVITAGGYGLPDKTKVKVEAPAELPKTDPAKPASD
jgi:multidrug efflux pump subunit AcrA (membrane-fusion protein)